MYKFNSLIVSSVSNLCRQLAGPIHVNGSSVCGSSLLQRTLCTSAVRLQETDETTTDFQKSSRTFSQYPPMPGQESSLRWDGKKYDELAILHIKATYNNTHIQLTDSAGQSLVRTSCGAEGFKNIKKTTPVAAQATGISAATKALAKGVTFVRVVVKGLGPGRQPAIKGLTMGGLEIVSITDNTPVPHNGCRPRKPPRN